jgi:uncharacterized protein YjbI with pentapeptide repeats
VNVAGKCGFAGVGAVDRDEALRLLKGKAEGVAEWNRRRGAGEEIPDLRKVDLTRADLGGALLSGADLTGAGLIRAKLIGSDLRGSDLRGSDLRGSDLRGADLRGADLSGASLFRADLRGARLDAQTALDAKWRLVWEIVNEPTTFRDLSGADLSGSDLHGSDLSGSDLSGSDLHGSDLSRAKFTGTNLGGSDLHGSDLSGSDLRGADLHGSDLRGVQLRGTHLDAQTALDAKWRLVWEIVNEPAAGRDLRMSNLIGAHLDSADLRSAKLSGAYLSESDLAGADLTGAILTGADLRGADLTEADLRGADLTGADLAGAGLTEAKLAGAALREVRLREADLSRADLSRADLSLARLIRCKLDDSVFDEADVTDCQVQESIGRPKPPTLLRVKDHPPLTGEDARSFFSPPATVEVYLTEVLTDEELGAFRFHLGDMRRQGVGINVHLTGERAEAGGTVLRFQSPTYSEVYDVLPVLLKPFRMSRAVEWAETYESLPERDRDAALTALAKVEAEDPEGRWLFAARMAEVFGSFPGAKITHLRDGRNRGVRIEVATNRTMYQKLAQQEQTGRSKPVTKQQIINVLADDRPRIALEDNSMTNETNAQGNIVGAAIGTGNTVKARDINAFISSVDQADPDLKRVLVEARKVLESEPLTGADKDDAADDLGKLAEEVTKPQPQPRRVKRLFESLVKLAPDVASILSSAVKIGDLIRG